MYQNKNLWADSSSAQMNIIAPRDQWIGEHLVVNYR